MEPDKLTSSRVEALTLHLEYAFDRGVNFRERVIIISNDIEYPLFDIVDAAMTEMEAMNRKKITIKLNSYGGSVYEALAIIGRLKRSTCRIDVEVYGKAMSAACLILASGHHRSVSKFAWVMHHGMSYGVYGSHEQNKAEVRQAEEESKAWAKWMAEFTKKDEKFWYKTGSKVDKYFKPEELLELGVADEVI